MCALYVTKRAEPFHLWRHLSRLGDSEGAFAVPLTAGLADERRSHALIADYWLLALPVYCSTLVLQSSPEICTSLLQVSTSSATTRNSAKGRRRPRDPL